MAVSNYQWQSIGPAPQRSRLTSNVAGRVMAISVSADYDGSQTPALYVSFDGGGLWRSANFESATPAWIPLTDGVDPAARAAVQAVTGITVDRTRPRTLYITVGNPAVGILKSTDGGDSWIILTNAFTGQWPLGKLVIARSGGTSTKVRS
jgi:hypothetical protein